jgi:transposase
MRAHSRWLATQSFTHPALHVVLAEYIQTIEDAAVRLERLTRQVAETAASWSMAPVVEAYQAMRGIAFISAITFVVEIGDVLRFETAPQLMAYLGLVSSESSTGERVKRAGITKAGNNRARRVLVESAWTYRFPARVSPDIQARLDGLPRSVRAIAWQGPIRRCARYRKLIMAGKLKTVAVTAIAREMAAFLWAIGQEVTPTAQA